MKRIIYLCVLALLAINLSCETEDIIVNEQNETFKTTESTELLQGSNLNQGIDSKIVLNQNLNINQNNFTRDIGEGFDDSGFGGTGFGDIGISDGEGNIYNGTNFLDNPPADYGETVLITYANGTTENQKRELRLSYQVTGELLYYEQCSIEPNKELWYLSTSYVTVTNCIQAGPCHETRSKNPPIGNPPLLLSTDIGVGTITTIQETHTQITISNALVGASFNDFCNN